MAIWLLGAGIGGMLGIAVWLLVQNRARHCLRVSSLPDAALPLVYQDARARFAVRLPMVIRPTTMPFGNGSAFTDGHTLWVGVRGELPPMPLEAYGLLLHEAGHVRLGHKSWWRKGLAGGAPGAAVGFGVVLAWQFHSPFWLCGWLFFGSMGTFYAITRWRQRRQEFAADAWAYRTDLAVGPALVDRFRRLEHTPRAVAAGGWFATHPSYQARVRHLQRLMQKQKERNE